MAIPPGNTGTEQQFTAVHMSAGATSDPFVAGITAPRGSALAAGVGLRLWRGITGALWALLCPFLWGLLRVFQGGWAGARTPSDNSLGQHWGADGGLHGRIYETDIVLADLMRRRLRSPDAHTQFLIDRAQVQLRARPNASYTLGQWLWLGFTALLALTLWGPPLLLLAYLTALLVIARITIAELVAVDRLIPLLLVFAGSIIAVILIVLLSYWLTRLRAWGILRWRSERQVAAAAIRDQRAQQRAIIEAFEAERQRISRDLHDGAQQYLVATMMKLGEVELMLQLPGTSDTTSAQVLPLVQQASATAERALTELRQTTSGMTVQVLIDRGLTAAVRELVALHDVPIRLRVPRALPELPQSIAITAYYVVAELVTNAVKYGHGAPISLLLMADAQLHISITDHGPGGAVLRPGHGLWGLQSRLEAFAGTLQISSPPGGPTLITAQIPLPLHSDESGLPAGFAARYSQS